MAGGVTWNEVGLVVFLLVIIVAAPKVPEIGSAIGERIGRLFQRSRTAEASAQLETSASATDAESSTRESGDRTEPRDSVKG